MKKLFLVMAVLALLAIGSSAFAAYGTVSIKELGVDPKIDVYGHYGVFGNTTAYVGVYNLDIIPPTMGLRSGAFCIEMQGSDPSMGYAPYTIVDLWEAPKTAGPDGQAMGVPKAALIKNLFAAHYADVAVSPYNAAAFQASVWDIIYGHVTDLNGANIDQSVKLDNAALNSTVASWVGDATNWNGPAFGYNLYAVTNDVRQDYVVVGTAVPEPMSIMLGIIGLGSVVGLKKRFRS